MQRFFLVVLLFLGALFFKETESFMNRTQSEAHMEVIDEKYDEILEDFSEKYDYPFGLLDDKVQQIIKKEKDLEETHFVLYNAGPAFLKILYTLYERIEKELNQVNSQGDFVFFRPKELRPCMLEMKKYLKDSIGAFGFSDWDFAGMMDSSSDDESSLFEEARGIQKFKEESDEHYETEQEALQDMKMSVNYALFGNYLNSELKNAKDCSFGFWLGGMTWQQQVIFEKLKFFLNSWDMNHNAYERLFALIDKYLNRPAGTPIIYSLFGESDNINKYYGILNQIFIPKEKIDDYVFLSDASGTLFEIYENKKFKDFMDQNKPRAARLSLNENEARFDIVQVGKQGPGKMVKSSLKNLLGCYINGSGNCFSNDMQMLDLIQGRLVLFPSFFDPKNNIKIFQYSLMPEETQKAFENELNELVDNIVGEWLMQDGHAKIEAKKQSLSRISPVVFNKVRFIRN
ncbi:MAG: hypothetical protein UR26_C0004G0052 [candidate division TM6 bacterium GW2011_GWF2_32_72]|nr:MAG: hypothetical protein UR26_C0004G0052 [candidate division TM6 bacterium GW2011_GWF2_32_72]